MYCVFWPSRFGKRPETIIDRVGPWLMTPRVMPAADTDLTGMPAGTAGASEWLRERHPEITWDGPKEPDPAKVEQGRRLAESTQADNGPDIPADTLLVKNLETRATTNVGTHE